MHLAAASSEAVRTHELEQPLRGPQMPVESRRVHDHLAIDELPLVLGRDVIVELHAQGLLAQQLGLSRLDDLREQGRGFDLLDERGAHDKPSITGTLVDVIRKAAHSEPRRGE